SARAVSNTLPWPAPSLEASPRRCCSPCSSCPPLTFSCTAERTVMLFPRINNAFAFILIFAGICATSALAQAPPAQNLPKLTLAQAEALAIQNHPQVQAAQNEVNYSNQQIVQSRAAFYPDVTGDLTGSQGNNLARIGAGDLSASRLFNRF